MKIYAKPCTVRSVFGRIMRRWVEVEDFKS